MEEILVPAAASSFCLVQECYFTCVYRHHFQGNFIFWTLPVHLSLSRRCVWLLSIWFHLQKAVSIPNTPCIRINKSLSSLLSKKLIKNKVFLIIQKNKKAYLNIISLYTTQIPTPKAGRKDKELIFEGTKKLPFTNFLHPHPDRCGHYRT